MAADMISFGIVACRPFIFSWARSLSCPRWPIIFDARSSRSFLRGAPLFRHLPLGAWAITGRALCFYICQVSDAGDIHNIVSTTAHAFARRRDRLKPRQPDSYRSIIPESTCSSISHAAIIISTISFYVIIRPSIQYYCRNGLVYWPLFSFIYYFHCSIYGIFDIAIDIRDGSLATENAPCRLSIPSLHTSVIAF